jgi:hypothetical protein
MILRRIIAHFRKQEWTAITIDFVIVVMGVFIGIQVSNWNEARQERVRDRQALALFIDELRLMQKEADYDLKRVTEVGAALSNGGAIARDCAASDADRALLAGAIAATLEWRVPDVRPSGLAEIGNSGTLARLANPGLSRAVGSINQTIRMFGDSMGFLGPRYDRAWAMLAPHLIVAHPMVLEGPSSEERRTPARVLSLAPQESLCASAEFQLGLMLLTDFYGSSLYNFSSLSENLRMAHELAAADFK